MKEVLRDLPHPYAWLDLQALDANIQYVRQACGEKSIRIATKSVRSVEALQYIMKNCPQVDGLMTFSAAETLYLAERGLNHFLIGYPVWEPPAIKQLLARDIDVTFMVDDVAQLALLQTCAEEVGTVAQLCIDLNVSSDFKWLYFGTKRSPLSSLQHVEAFLQQLREFPRLQVVGVMAYDAQIAGVAEHTRGIVGGAKAQLIRQLKKRSQPHVTKLRQHVVAHMRHHLSPLRFVNAGGSGSIAHCAKQPDVTEITVGSAFFAPALFDGYDALNLKPAAGFALRVTRQFSRDVVVCHGGGYIASGAVGLDRLPQFLEPERFAFTSLEGAGEVQTPVMVKQGTVAIGDTILLRHAKAGELCERFLQLHAVRGDCYIGPMATYRGDGQCFL